MQGDMLVATTLAGNEVLRTDEVDMPGRELKQALQQALGHANFVMVTPGAEKLIAGAKGVAEQFRALVAARRRAAERMHPQWHRADQSELRRLILPCMRGDDKHGYPVKKSPIYGHVIVDMDGQLSLGALLCRMQKIPYDMGEEVQSALNAFAESERDPPAERRRSRSPTRLQARLVTAAQRVRDWRP